MAEITLPFSTNPADSGVSIGDTIYCIYNANINSSGGFNVSNNTTDIQELGTVVAILPNSIIIDTGSIVLNVNQLPTATDFIFFEKSKSVSNSKLLGYYAEIKFVNNSTDKSELFSVGMEVVESSK
tara:strand:+ start:695 stop:1072 length:378 start_codon:yes stop_codon:yes gene_type:complete